MASTGRVSPGVRRSDVQAGGERLPRARDLPPARPAAVGRQLRVSKPINSHTSNEFHVWQPRLYDRGLAFCDVDAWAIALTDVADQYRPVALLELKRSTFEVERWRPFDDDRAQYASLLALARAAGVPLYVVYFRKGIAI